MMSVRVAKSTFLIFLFLSQILTLRTRAFADPYCGIYSIYGAASSLGVESDFETLISSRYVSSRKGSTVKDLVEAGNSIGVQVTPSWHLGEASLRSARDPLVLHFCSYGQLNSYDHWVLFLGIDNGKAIVVDPDAGKLPMHISEVLLRWDGVALAIHLGDKPTTKFSNIETGGFFPWLIFLSCLCYLTNTIKAKRGLITFLGVFLVFQAALLFWSTETYVHRPHQTLYALSNHNPARFKSISRGEIEKRLKNKNSNTLLVDARYKSDFERGSIPNSVNLPVNVNKADIQKQFSNIDKNTEVIVYCLSENCSFDRQLATKIAGEGLNNIRIYEEGWYGWIRREQ